MAIEPAACVCALAVDKIMQNLKLQKCILKVNCTKICANINFSLYGTMISHSLTVPNTVDTHWLVHSTSDLGICTQNGQRQTKMSLCHKPRLHEAFNPDPNPD